MSTALIRADSAILSPSWELIAHHDTQQDYVASTARFNVLACGRRTGKTLLAKRKVVRASLHGTAYDDARFFLAAPVYGQAKRIFWTDLKRMIPPSLIHSTSESDLMIRTILGSEIWVVGLDKPERIEGSPWDGGVITEFANVKPEAWRENIRPALADRLGWCDFESVPEGRNHFYKLYNDARAESAERGAKSAWRAFHWTSEEVLPLYGRSDDLEQARRDLDELTYKQEYLASFIVFQGQCYHAFDGDSIKPIFDRYDKALPLIVCFDFNVSPGTATIVQEMSFGKDDDALDGTGVIGEVYIERDSNTPRVCEKIIEDWGQHEGRILCHGDATGGSGGTAQTEGSDWDIISKRLSGHYGDRRVSMQHPASNPRERARVNAVNSHIKAHDGTRRLLVDPRCKFSIRDFEGVSAKDDGSIDKDRDRMLTHLTDGLGYYIAEEFPIRDGKAVSTSEMDYV